MNRPGFPFVAAVAVAAALISASALLAECPGGSGCSGSGSTAPTEPMEPPKPPKPVIHPRLGEGREDRPAALVRDAATAPSGASEYVVAGRPAEVARAEALSERLGLATLRRRSLTSVGLSMLVIDPNSHDIDDLRRALAKDLVRVTLDRNTTYRTAGADVAYAGSMVGLDVSPACALRVPVTIGLVDGPVDATIPALKDVPIQSYSALTERDIPGSADHATGLASLIAGHDAGGTFGALAQGARLLSAVAFAREDGRDAARTDAVAAALDWLVGKGADVISLSLTGPKNDTLAFVLGLVAKRGPVLLAAVGNDGRDDVSFPASDPNVLGLTAIDARKHLYRSANFGEEVDFAAPGVDLLVAESDGLVHRSGTSYATAVASAVIAHLLADGVDGARSVEFALRRDAEDLGAPGHDPRFGWGLMRIADCTK